MVQGIMMCSASASMTDHVLRTCGVQDALGVAGAAARVQQKQRVLRIHPLHLCIQWSTSLHGVHELPLMP